MTNLLNRGLILEDHSTKNTLLFTIPRSNFKSSAQDLPLKILDFDPCSASLVFLPNSNRRSLSLLSSKDSDLEAFSHNPTDGSFAALPFQATVNANCLNLRFLSYRVKLLLQQHLDNPTLGELCFTMIGRANIDGSKSNVAINAWLPQVSY